MSVQSEKNNIITLQEMENYIELTDDNWLWDQNANEIDPVFTVKPEPEPEHEPEPVNTSCRKRDYETLDSVFVEDLNLNGHMIWWKPIPSA